MTGVIGLILHDHDYDAATKVYTAPVDVGETPPDVFHADRECPHLSRSSHASVATLAQVLTTRGPPYETCDYCTLSVEETISIAAEFDDVDPEDVTKAVKSPVNESEIPERGMYLNV